MIANDARPSPHRGRALAGLVAAALLLTLLNCVKPLHVDDPVFYRYAAHMASHPFDPYGFQLFSQPAMHTLSPPVLPYWWGLAIRLFGDRPPLWKASLFPFCLLFVLALHALLRRFAQGQETPLLWMTVVSPWLLPSVNLMLDIPALALGLTAVAVFIRAIECERRLLVVVAGLVAGLAMQTKYTALVVPAVTLLYAALMRKVSWGVVAASLAVLVFVSWEWLLTLVYGESHFLYNFRLLGGLSLPHRRMLHHVLPLIAILGGVVPAVAILGLGALGASRRTVGVAAALVGLGYAVLAIVPDQYSTFLIDRDTGKTRLTLNNLVFGTLGIGVCATLAAVVRAIGRAVSHADGSRDRFRAHPVEWFLLLWCGLELTAYFVLSPFPAVRRVFGLVVAATLLIGHFASSSAGNPRYPPMGRRALGVSALLGSLFYSVDLLDALAERETVEQAATVIDQRDGPSTIWYAGCCGFQFYAERAGMTEMIPNHSVLRRGDWVVVPDQRLRYANWCLPRESTQLVATIRVDDILPLTMTPGYYAGRTPMHHLDGPRMSAEVYRVELDFVACTPT